jgi:hypothetical protein
MGGAFVHGGNVNPATEANFWNDAEAADLVCALGPKVRVLQHQQKNLSWSWMLPLTAAASRLRAG